MGAHMNAARDYYASLSAALAEGPPPELEDAAAILHDAVQAGNAIYTFGNGASAALASHIATDYGKSLSKHRRVRIASLVDNAALLTAYANDENYECIFAVQLRVLARRGDVALGISGSGTSANVIEAFEQARSDGARTIGLTGSMPGSERLDACCDVVVRAPLQAIEQIEDMHVVFGHVLMHLLAERLQAQ
jgi:D-sedoheptulose 7-phosphate isomerase